jgi:hypothetical protein
MTKKKKTLWKCYYMNRGRSFPELLILFLFRVRNYAAGTVGVPDKPVITGIVLCGQDSAESD